jgi:ribosome biogenesis protein Nip4
MGGTCSTNGVNGRKLEGKSPLRRPSRRELDTIKMELTENGRKDVDWINLTQDTDQWLVLVNTVMNLRVR